MPKVSINVITKNRAELLAKSLASLQAQTFRDFELVIVNDGSTDETNKVIESFLGSKQVIQHSTSVGITVSRQEALNNSSGEYVAILDDDDQWIEVGKLELQLKHFLQHPEAVLVGTFRKVSLAQGSRIDSRPTNDSSIRQTMLFRNNFFTSSVMFKREAALAVGGFIARQEDLAEDYDLWLRLGGVGQLANLPLLSVLYRMPNYQKSKLVKFFSKQLYLIEKFKLAYPYYQAARLFLLARLSYYNLL